MGERRGRGKQRNTEDSWAQTMVGGLTVGVGDRVGASSGVKGGTTVTEQQ